MVWIQAEISNLARPGSGHWYFSLKDEHAQVRCAMFRNRNMHSQFTPADGQLVLVRAKISLYEPRGEFQLIIEHMEAAGEGALRQQFELLKQKLQREGLFESLHKKPLPPYPESIGIITSPTGAAIHDILTTLNRRYPILNITIYPTSVQGASAAGEIIRAIKLAEQQADCDILILARGGGSLEDLWSFNNEQLAHAIFNCPIPVVTGIGHDVDFTIADFVADHRSPTPTGAAEFITPDKREILKHLDNFLRTFIQLTRGKIFNLTHALKTTQARLVHPERRLQDTSQKLDEHQMRLNRIIVNTLKKYQQYLTGTIKRLGTCVPQQRILHSRQQLAQYNLRLVRAVDFKIHNANGRLKEQVAILNALSPIATLDRGYAIVTRVSNKKIVHNSHELKLNDEVQTRLSNGSFISKVTDIAKD